LSVSWAKAGWPRFYLAADIKHERKVALKVLKPELAAVVGAAGFLAEIKTTANLQLQVTGTGQDQVRYPAKLIGKLNHLAQVTSVGDFQPTDQDAEVQVLLRNLLANASADLEELINSELAEFNRPLRERGLDPVIRSDGGGDGREAAGISSGWLPPPLARASHRPAPRPHSALKPARMADFLYPRAIPCGTLLLRPSKYPTEGCACP